MKIGIISDSHENMTAISSAVRIFNEAGIKTLLHAGDIISPITYGEFSKLKCRMIAVFGNNDGDRSYLREKYSGKAEFYDFYTGVLGGKRFFMKHTAEFVDEIASSGGFDAVVYGHTHRVDIRKAGRTLIINPGESGGWLLGRKTAVMLETDDLSYKLIEL